MLQLDQTAHVAPNADLVAWSRLGSSYDGPSWPTRSATQELLELQGFVRLARESGAVPGRDGGVAGPAASCSTGRSTAATGSQANEGCRLDILERLRQDGPLLMRDLPDTCVVPWKSSGWTNNRNVSQLLEFMMQRGEVAIAGRDGRDRLWDLASRVYPDEPVVPVERPGRSATSSGCARSASCGRRAPRARASRSTAASRGSGPSSTVSAVSGASTRSCSAGPSPDVRRCSRRWTVGVRPEAA